jgi:DMSO reductase family type II enzyme chaperone
MKRYDTALARALLYHAAARLFSYPDDGLSDTLATAQLVASALPDGGVLEQHVADVVAAWMEAEESESGAAGEYTWLFQRNVRCPLHETAYDSERRVAMAHDMAEIAGYYAAFGVKVSEVFRDLPDHLSMELEFISYLYAKEAYALEHNEKGHAKVCREARQQFLREHLAHWFPAFAERARQNARQPLYVTATALAAALLLGERLPMEEGDGHTIIAPA